MSVEVIARVLGDHVAWTNAADGCMGCGWLPDNPDFAGVKHRKHVAEQVSIALVNATRTPERLVEALRDAIKQNAEYPAWRKRAMPTLRVRDK